MKIAFILILIGASAEVWSLKSPTDPNKHQQLDIFPSQKNSLTDDVSAIPTVGDTRKTGATHFPTFSSDKPSKSTIVPIQTSYRTSSPSQNITETKESAATTQSNKLQTATSEAHTAFESSPITTTSETVRPSTQPKLGKTGKWMVKDLKTNEVCVILEMKSVIHIKYRTNHWDRLDFIRVATVAVPPNAESFGDCGGSGKGQFVYIRWNETSRSQSERELYIRFNKLSDYTYDIAEFNASIRINKWNFPGSLNIGEMWYLQATNISNFVKVKSNHSFSCTPEVYVSMLMQGWGNIFNYGTLILSDLHLEAFRHKSDTKFSRAVVCHLNKNEVLIAFCCSIGALIFLVWISYMYYRRRQNQPYIHYEGKVASPTNGKYGSLRNDEEGIPAQEEHIPVHEEAAPVREDSVEVQVGSTS